MARFNSTSIPFRSALRVLVWSVLLLALLIVSELTYLGTHGELAKPLVYYHLTRYESAIQKGEFERAWRELEQAAYAHLLVKSFRYDNQFPTQLPKLVGGVSNGSMIKQLLSNESASIEAAHLMRMEEYGLAFLHYQLAVDAFQEGGNEWIGLLLQRAIYLAPELSYFQVELANFYLAQANLSKAEFVIEFCLEFEHPKQHCMDYRDVDLANGVVFPVGFLRGEIEDYYGLE